MSSSDENAPALWDRASLKTELVTVLDAALCTFDQLWTHIGIDDEQRLERIRTVGKHLTSLLKEMVAEEQSLKERLEQNVDSYEQQLATLCSELDLPAPEITTGNCSLLRRDKELGQMVERLTKEKAGRQHAHSCLNEVRSSLHNKLGLEPICMSPRTAVPSKEWLQELEDIVTTLEEEKAKRFAEFLEKREVITALFGELGIGPSDPFEFDITVEEPEHFCLSDKNMLALSSLEHNMKQKVAEYKAEALSLRGKMIGLWCRLEVPQGEQESFLATHKGYNADAIEVMRSEISRCENLKLQQIEAMIKKVRQEICKWWSMCFFGPKQQSQFKEFTSSVYNEEVLTAHEQEAARLASLHASNAQRLYDPLTKRAELWAQMLEYDAREHDPSRYANRGGGLLKEEKERKKVLRDLPKIEQELKDAAEAWEQDNGHDFLVYDSRVPDYTRRQWEEYQRQKEEAKLDRQKAKTKPVNETLRTKPPTPMKRHLEGGMSPPKSTPKVRKLNDTAALSGTRSFARTAQPSVFASPALKQASRTPCSQRKVTGTPARMPSTHSVLTPSSKPNVPSQVAAKSNTGTKKLAPPNGNATASNHKGAGGDVSSVASYREFKGGLSNFNDENVQCSTILHGNT